MSSVDFPGDRQNVAPPSCFGHPRTEANIRLGRGEGERDVDRKTTSDVAGTSWCNILSMYRSGWSASDVFFDVQRLIHESREEE